MKKPISQRRIEKIKKDLVGLSDDVYTKLDEQVKAARAAPAPAKISRKEPESNHATILAHVWFLCDKRGMTIERACSYLEDKIQRETIGSPKAEYKIRPLYNRAAKVAEDNPAVRELAEYIKGGLIANADEGAQDRLPAFVKVTKGGLLSTTQPRKGRNLRRS